MIGRFFKKMYAILFAQHEEEKDVARKKQERQVGRFEREHRQVEPKVIHQYPKRGNFRFPVIEDEPFFWNRSEVVAEERKKEEGRTDDDVYKQRPARTHHFQPTSIPSPIFGFHARTVEEKRPTEQTVQEEVERHKEASDEFLDINEQDTIEVEELIIEEATVEDASTYEDEQEIERSTEQEPSIEMEGTEDESESEPIAEEEQIATVQKKETIVVQQSQEEHDQPNRRRSPIPYNVLMLPSDRMKNERKRSNYARYQFPPLHLLNIPPTKEIESEEQLMKQASLLEETLQQFNVKANVVRYTRGPTVTQFEIQLAPGIKVSKVTGLIDDMKLALAARDIRIEAPIPGKNTIGIEVPNLVSQPVFLREILRSEAFIRSKSPLTVALGLDISGAPVVTDLSKMPHGLVAGATGSGKSVCINSILVSLLYRATPDEVKLLLIDPKVVELAPYNDLPHLVTPVITDAKLATASLKWAVEEMERRYELFAERKVRDISRYNELFSDQEARRPALPYIVIIIDELADLMMVAPGEVEEAICRIAQKARACGIHLLLATQRPSVDVITGLIKANIPTRIAFSVSSQVDSRTIIDTNGAERLLGRGDMLFHASGSPKPQRLQGTFVSDDEIEAVVTFVKQQRPAEYVIHNDQLAKETDSFEQDDELFEEACLFVIEQESASASMLQRRFRIGYNRAARLIDMMEAIGVVSESMGSKPRHVLLDEAEFHERMTSL